MEGVVYVIIIDVKMPLVAGSMMIIKGVAKTIKFSR